MSTRHGRARLGQAETSDHWRGGGRNAFGNSANSVHSLHPTHAKGRVHLCCVLFGESAFVSGRG